MSSDQPANSMRRIADSFLEMDCVKSLDWSEEEKQKFRQRASNPLNWTWGHAALTPGGLAVLFPESSEPTTPPKD
jgi:hypothetical protein